MIKKLVLNSLLLLFIFNQTIAQTEKELDQIADSLYIHEVQHTHHHLKILHAEPLFIDLIRDLGARKGEKEWNIATGLTDKSSFDQYTALVEYEWAPINRLGLEVELPFSFYYNSNGIKHSPGSKLNSIKLAAQYTFIVSEKLKTSVAAGYIHEFELSEFNKYTSQNLFTGNIFNPFLIAAKRWGDRFHTLIYTGPTFEKHLHTNHLITNYQANTNFHYMIPGTRNFIGLEINKNFQSNDFDMTLRPQMRVAITENLLIGIVNGIPLKRESERFSTFLRLIYEPKHKKHT